MCQYCVFFGGGVRYTRALHIFTFGPKVKICSFCRDFEEMPIKVCLALACHVVITNTEKDYIQETSF